MIKYSYLRNLTLLLFVLLTLCSLKASNSLIAQGSSYELRDNKLYSKFDSCDLSSQKNISFFEFKTLKISSDYLVLDSLEIDLNGDNINDQILVLSPLIQENDNYKDICYQTLYNKRLICIALSVKGNFVYTINENAILNRSEYQSEPFRKITKEKEGFSIQFYIGTSTRCYYNFYFNCNGESIFLNKINYECYLTDLSNSKKNIQIYKNSDSTSLKTINLRKYINIPKLK